MKTNESEIKPYLFNNNDFKARPDIVRLKHAFGLSYGVVIGVSFAIATWAVDGFILSQAHTFLPWLKLIIGILLCGSVTGFAGWITARFERWYFTLPAWIGIAVFFSWLLIILPLQIAPYVSSLLGPQWQGLISYSTFSELSPRFVTAFMWILIFVVITGVMQIPLVEPAAFSVSVFGKIAPFLLGMFVIGLGGFVADSLNNQPLRAAAVSLDHSIQFVLDNQGTTIDPSLSRANHAGAVRGIKEQVTPERVMTIGSYDSSLGEVNMLVQFRELTATCIVIFEQPAFCKAVTPK